MAVRNNEKYFRSPEREKEIGKEKLNKARRLKSLYEEILS